MENTIQKWFRTVVGTFFAAAFDFINFKKLAPELRLHSVGQKGCRTAVKCTHSFITPLLARGLKRVQCLFIHSEVHSNRT